MADLVIRVADTRCEGQSTGDPVGTGGGPRADLRDHTTGVRRRNQKGKARALFRSSWATGGAA